MDRYPHEDAEGPGGAAPPPDWKLDRDRLEHFAIADSLPGVTASAERAARQIVDACRYGDPELTITLPARIAMVANHFMPALVAHTLMLANRILPGVNEANGDRKKRGAESASKWAPSVATVLSDKAAVVNNEV